AKNYARLRRATQTAVLWTTIFCILCCGGMLLFRDPLIQAFNKNDPAVLAIGTKALFFQGLMFLGNGFQVVYTTKFMGMGKGLEGGLVSLGRQGFFFIPIIYLFTAAWGLNGLILAQPAADLLSFLLISVLAFRNKKEEQTLIFAQAA
ncbi:MAG: MATE family efflux transporter, partial [Anaerotignum sp.]|nr:MATE family efflux transporter [Anaerotignum sp.]